jgi:hypothetical protein
MSSLAEEVIQPMEAIFIGVLEYEFVVDELKPTDLVLEDVLLLLPLVGRAHQAPCLPHWVHCPSHVLLVLVEGLQAVLAVVLIVVF